MFCRLLQRLESPGLPAQVIRLPTRQVRRDFPDLPPSAIHLNDVLNRGEGRTTRANGPLGISNCVPFWIFRMSINAFVPGR